MLTKEPLPSPVNVGAGKVAFFDLPVDRRYHSLSFKLVEDGNGSAAAMIDKIEVLANGKVQRAYSGARLNGLNRINGDRYAINGTNDRIITIHFAEPSMALPREAENLAWGTQDISTLQIKISIAAGATNPVLTGEMVYDRVFEPMGPIVRYQEIPVNAGAGRFELPTIPRGLGRIRRIHAYSADVQMLKIVGDGVTFFERELEEQNADLEHRGFKPLADTFSFISDLRQIIGGEETLALRRQVGEQQKDFQDFRLIFQMANAGTFDLGIEWFGLRL